MSIPDIDNRFNHHPPKDDPTRLAHEAVRSVLKATALELERYVPPGREFALVLTRLEEAMFWANAGIARS